MSGVSNGGTELDVFLGTVALDPSWADETPRCYVCGETIKGWENVVALPGCYSGEDDPPDHLIPVHREGCLAL